jgi:hypothetical protein
VVNTARTLTTLPFLRKGNVADNQRSRQLSSLAIPLSAPQLRRRQAALENIEGESRANRLQITGKSCAGSRRP